jgi:hypothetical protein
MSDVRMIGPADFHGGRVSSFETHDGAAQVIVQGESGRVYRVGFGGVRSLTERRAAGMPLHGLVDRAAVRGDPSTFTFVSGDASGETGLELVAEGVLIEALAPTI